MPIKRLTSHDVARRAGVSRATVSLVLNRSDSVAIAQETRERVLKAAAELGYKPNSAARMLVSGQSETIGLLLSDPSILLVDQFVTRVLYGIERANRELGLHVLMEGLESGTGAAYDDLVESRRIDGLIVINPRTGDEALVSLIDKNFPVVLVGSVRHPAEVSVTFAMRPALMAAVSHIVGLGHRRIGAVTFSPRSFVAAEARLAALDAGLRAHGLVLDEDAIEDGAFSPESGYRAGLALLRRRPDITAIFAGNDTIAIGVLSAAREAGRNVPGDLSLVGFDDLPFAPWLTPALTTIRTDGVRQGMLATEMLSARLNGRPLAASRVRLEPEFVIRASTGPVPSSAPSPSRNGKG